MAGKEHILKIDEPLYFYGFISTPREKDNPEKAIAHVAIRLLPPYLPLQSLEDEPKRTPNFKASKLYLSKMVKIHRTIDKEERVTIPPEYIPDDFDFNNIIEMRPKKSARRSRPPPPPPVRKEGGI